MHIIDTHQHFWTYHPQQYEWIDDKMEALRQDFHPEQLHEIYLQNAITGCVSVQAISTEEETKSLLDYAKKFDFIKGVVGWVDLCSPQVKTRLHHFKKNSKFKGVRHVLQSEPDEFMEKPEFLKGLSLLEDLDLTYDILIYPKHLFSAYQLVKKFPNQRFIIDHLAKPHLKTKQIDHWRDLMQNFKDQPNVYCKVSGMVTEADWKNWRYPDFTPVLDTITDVFGPDRMMYGSDWPVCLLAGSYKNILDIVKTYTADWNEEDIEKVFYKNAVQFYKLDL
jgi:L-fuconolactonase